MTWLTDKLPPVEDLGALAVAQTWQVTLVAVFAGIAAVTVARRRPHLAYLLWMLVVIKCLTPPVWASPTGAFSWLRVSASSQPRQQPRQQTPHFPQIPEPAGTIEPAPLEISSPIAPINEELPLGEPGRNRPLDPATWFALALVAGSLGLAALVAWQGWRYRRRLRSSAVPADAQLERLFEKTRSRLGVSRPVRLIVSRDSLGPAAVGVFKPTIVIPQSLAATASPEEIEPILAHELLHHRRGDVVAGWLQLAAQVLWWFHPLVWWANRAATRERERACDEEVMAGLGCDPAQYAQGLIGVLELRRSLRPMFVPGMRPAEISKRRIERILNESATFHRRTPHWCWAVSALLALVALPGAAREPNVPQPLRDSRVAPTTAKAQDGRPTLYEGEPPDTVFTVPSGSVDETGKPVPLKIVLPQRKQSKSSKSRPASETWGTYEAFIVDDKVVPDPSLKGSPEHYRALVALRGLGATVEGKLLPNGQVEISVTISAGWKAGPDGLKHLAQLDHLERLSINDILAVVVDKKEGLYRYQVNGSTEHGVNDAWLAHLAGLKGLKSLEIHNNCHATDAGLAHLAGLVELETLAIGGEGITDAGMRQLAPLTKLRRVYLSNVKIADAGLAALAGAKELELLSISSSELHGEGFAVLAGLERLSDLSLQYCPIDDKGLEAISQFKLKRLLLGNAQITDTGLVHLKNQTELLMLTMEEPQSADFTGAGLINLAGLGSLRDLRLQVSKLAADDLATLTGMDQLTQLILNAPVTDEGLGHLAKLAQLKSLFLLGAELSDAGLRQLFGLKELKNLVLPAKGLSEEAKAALKQALPNTEITFHPEDAVKL